MTTVGQTTAVTSGVVFHFDDLERSASNSSERAISKGSAKKINPVIGYLAETLMAHWAHGLPLMSYRKYVTRVLIPGNRYADQRIRAAQDEKIGEFLHQLKEWKNPLLQQATQFCRRVEKEYEKVDFFNIQADGNGTSVLGDSTKTVDLIISYLAEVLKDRWAASAEKMTYKNWVQKILIPGNKRDKAIKAAQEKKIGTFLTDLKEWGHPSHAKAVGLCDAVAKEYLDPQTGKMKFKIFPAMINLIQRVQGCSLVTLRTLGPDRTAISAGLTAAGIKMTQMAQMIQGGMQFEGQEEVISGPRLLEVIQEKSKAGENIGGQDQFKFWSDNDSKAIYGKVIACVRDAKFKDKTFVTIFLDDNLEKPKPKDEEKTEMADPEALNIAYPKDVYDRPTSWNSRGIIGIRVNPIKAALDENYFIRKVNKALLDRGFKPL